MKWYIKRKSEYNSQKRGDMMTDFELLNKKISDSGMTITAISNKCGISRETLYNRLNGVSEFKASEIVSLTQTLHLTSEERDEIFLNKIVN